jgi:N-acetylneuraminic acid mutarotase
MPHVNRRAAIAVSILIALLLVCSSSLAFAAPPNTWVTEAPNPTARFGSGAASVNGIVYVIGGQPSYFGCGMTGENDAYNPATNTWTTMAPMPTPRNLLSVAVLNGIIYAVGGSEGCFPPSRVVEAYDPSTNTWSTKGLFPDTGGGLGVAGAAIGVVNGILYVAGGENTVNPTFATLYAYDPVADSWSAIASMPDVRFAAAGAVVNGEFYVVGGFAAVGFATSTFVYDPTSNTWSTKAPLSDPRASLAAAVVGSNIYAIGGVDASSLLTGVPVATAEAYDPATDTWTTLPSMPTIRAYPVAAQVNGTIYVIGGLNFNTGASTSVVEAYTPEVVPTSADQCKKNGWMTLYQANGSSFKNQGDCIQYVNTGK